MDGRHYKNPPPIPYRGTVLEPKPVALAAFRPRRGDCFIHAKWLDNNHEPLLCRVTKVTTEAIYWRPLDGGAPMYFTHEQISRYVKEWKL